MAEHSNEGKSDGHGEGKGKDEVTVKAPSGFPVEEDYHPNEKVGVLLRKALADLKKAGQITDDSVEYVLVKGDTDLQTEVTLSQAGVVAGDTLKLMVKAPPTDGNA